MLQKPPLYFHFSWFTMFCKVDASSEVDVILIKTWYVCILSILGIHTYEHIISAFPRTDTALPLWITRWNTEKTCQMYCEWFNRSKPVSIRVPAMKIFEIGITGGGPMFRVDIICLLVYQLVTVRIVLDRLPITLMVWCTRVWSDWVVGTYMYTEIKRILTDFLYWFAS